MSALKATPTEYKGVLYRSKSEAMFARYLELIYEQMNNESGKEFFIHKVLYEPEFLGRPDFVVTLMHGCDATIYTQFTIIEYKPKMPTITYQKAFFKKRDEFAETLDCDSYNVFLCIYYGSIWQERGVINPNSTWSGWPGFDRFEEEICNTRFDLEYKP